jgi:hypothetical protein
MKNLFTLILIMGPIISSIAQVGISRNPVFSPTEDLDVDGSVKVREELILSELAPVTGRKNLIITSGGTVDTAASGNYAISSYGSGSYLCAPNSAITPLPGLTRTLTLLTPSYVTVLTDGGLVNTLTCEYLYSAVDISITVNGNALTGGSRRIVTQNYEDLASISNWSLSRTVFLPAGTHTFSINAAGRAGTVPALISSNGITTSSYSLTEGFAGGTVAPSGWGFTSIGGTYTSTGNVGQSSPSLMMDATGDRVITPVYSGPASSLSFWLKGLTTNSGSALLVEGSTNGTNWTTIHNITNGLPGNGMVMTYTSASSPALPAGMIQFRFTYTKSAGNLAFDDVTVMTAQSANYSVNQGQMSLQILAK